MTRQDKLEQAARDVLDAARFVPLCGISAEHTRLFDAISALSDALIVTPPRRKPTRYEIERELARQIAQMRDSMPPPTTGEDDELPF